MGVETAIVIAAVVASATAIATRPKSIKVPPPPDPDAKAIEEKKKKRESAARFGQRQLSLGPIQLQAPGLRPPRNTNQFGN